MWLVIALFLMILGLLLFLDTQKPKNYPPGPKWWPIVGSALRILQVRKKTKYLFKAFDALVEEYGTVVGLKVGKDRIVLVSGKDALRELFASTDLAGRPVGIFYEIRTWGERRGLLLTDEDLWQEQRRFVIRELREFGFGRRNMSTMIEEETQAMVGRIHKELATSSTGSVSLAMNKFLNVHILNTIWMMLSGVRYHCEDKKVISLIDRLNDLFNSVDMVGAPFSQFPILRFIAPESSGYKNYVDTHLSLWDFLKAELERHKDNYDPENLRDFIDVYLKAMGTTQPYYCETQLMAICLDMFEAGTETTTKTLQFAVLDLMRHPEIQKKAREELDRVLGQRPATLDDRPLLPYMECLVLEVLRLFSAKQVTIPHRALRDTSLQGYSIPKGTMLVGNLSGTLTGPESGMEDPFRFNPERFIKDGKISIPESYLPFGFGKRRCLGEGLAKGNVFLFIAAFLQNFYLEIDPEAPPSAEIQDGVTVSPTPYKVLITPRE